MEYIPTPRNRRADYAILITGVLAICVFCVASLIPAYGGYIQCAGLIILTAAIYLAVRYRFTQFRYLIAEENGEEVFTVFRKQGRRSIAECRISVSYLKSVKRYTSKKDIPREGVSVYDYTVTISPKDVCFVLFDSGLEKKTGVIIECSTAFEQYLNSIKIS